MVVTFDRGFVVDSTFGFGEQFTAAQPAAGAVVTVLIDHAGHPAPARGKRGGIAAGAVALRHANAPQVSPPGG